MWRESFVVRSFRFPNLTELGVFPNNRRRRLHLRKKLIRPVPPRRRDFRYSSLVAYICAMVTVGVICFAGFWPIGFFWCAGHFLRRLSWDFPPSAFYFLASTSAH